MIRIIDDIDLPDGVYDAGYFGYTVIIKCNGEEYKYKTDVGIRQSFPSPSKVKVMNGKGWFVDKDTEVTNEKNIMSYDKFKENKIKKQQNNGIFEPLSQDMLYVKDLQDEWTPVKEPVEIIQITGILQDVEEISKIEENNNILGVNLANQDIKRGETIYLTAMVKTPGLSYSAPQMSVIKVRVVDIYVGLSKLNSLK